MIHTKDYYSILEVAPSASLDEIKKAYRRLALQYHPDTTNEDAYAMAHFVEVKEAYEVLTHPGRKEQYLQQRWYEQSIGKKKKQPVITPATVLQQALELEKHVSRLDIHRMDKQGLFEYMDALTDDEVIVKLERFDEPSVKKEIVRLLIHSSRLLPSDKAQLLHNKFLRIYNDPEITALQATTLRQQRKNEIVERYKPIFILAIAILICLLIVFLGNR